MNTPSKTYTWRIVSSLKDGDEFTMQQCGIDWGLFKQYCMAICDKRVLWPLDLIISQDGSKVKCIG